MPQFYYVVNTFDKNFSPVQRKGYVEAVGEMKAIEKLIADGADTFIEIGPGRTLTGFMKKINRKVNVYNVSAWEDVERVLHALQLQEERAC